MKLLHCSRGAYDGRLFPPRNMQDLAPVLSEIPESVSTQFASSAALQSYLKLIVQPPSKAWRYQLNGKSGNTFTLNLLYELEHGYPFRGRVAVSETGNQHPDFALFAQVGSGLLSTALVESKTWEDFCNFPGLRLATVRHPAKRALSGFRYLCRSHDVGDRRFLHERLRLSALTGFDFDTDRDTVRGFELFLAYIRDYADSFGAEAVDPHWRLQALHIRPDLYRPDITGRTEEMASFAQTVAARLDRPLISDLSEMRSNASSTSVSDELLRGPSIHRLIEDIYGQDFDLFEYARDPTG